MFALTFADQSEDPFISRCHCVCSVGGRDRLPWVHASAGILLPTYLVSWRSRCAVSSQTVEEPHSLCARLRWVKRRCHARAEHPISFQMRRDNDPPATIPIELRAASLHHRVFPWQLNSPVDAHKSAIDTARTHLFAKLPLNTRIPPTSIMPFISISASLLLLVVGTAIGTHAWQPVLPPPGCPVYTTLLLRNAEYRKHCEGSDSDPHWPCFTFWYGDLGSVNALLPSSDIVPDDHFLVKDGNKIGERPSPFPPSPAAKKTRADRSIVKRQTSRLGTPSYPSR